MQRRLLRHRTPEEPHPAPDAPWSHPQANRRIALPGGTVAYRLVRSRRRTIGFSIDASGLTVRAPGRTALAEIEAALRRKTGWIRDKLAAARLRQHQLQSQRIQWQDGACVPYLGGQLMLRVSGSAGVVRPSALASCNAIGDPVLQLRVTPDADAGQLAVLTQRWLQEQARARFAARLDHFSRLLGVCWRRLRLSSARTRWGSASTRGTISLHWRLIQLAPEIIDYVVVHELAHLLEMNHSARFWAHVARVLPDWPARRAALRDVVLPPWT